MKISFYLKSTNRRSHITDVISNEIRGSYPNLGLWLQFERLLDDVGKLPLFVVSLKIKFHDFDVHMLPYLCVVDT